MQSEITVEVTCNRKRLFAILERNGFFFKETIYITDYYFTYLDTKRQNIDFKTLSKSSMLIRDVTLDRKYFSTGNVTTLLYKKKQVDDDDRVQSEQKISCRLDNARDAKRIFTMMGLTNWCTKKITGYVFKRDNFELLVQEVEGFGLFIEIEDLESKAGLEKRAQNKLIKIINEMEIPIKPDYHINIAYCMYLKALADKAKVKADGKIKKVAGAKES